MSKFELLLEREASTGDVVMRIEGRIPARDVMRVGSHEHLVARLMGALDDAEEMWRKECQ
jgi:hypothetical protein